MQIFLLIKFVLEMQKESTTLPSINLKETVEIISKFIKDKIDESKTEGLVMGLSGGLDSTTAAYISLETVNRNKILGLVLPSQTTTAEDIEDALSLAEHLGIEKEVIPIDGLIEPFQHLCAHSSPKYHNKLADANLKARIRMMILYYHANSLNRLVLGTGNRTELLVGYFTKYGDGGVDLLPLGDLYKTQVREIAENLRVPEKIIFKDPTAGLWPGQTDEQELGIKYSLLDKILYLLADENLDTHEVALKLQIPEKEVLRIKIMIESSEHKLMAPPTPKLI